MVEATIAPTLRSRPLLVFAPTLAVMAYPWLLRAFHAFMIDEKRLLAALFLLLTFTVPVVNYLFVVRSSKDSRPTIRDVRMRRVSFFGIAAPTFFVFLGVVQGLLHSPVPDEGVWIVGWGAFAIWAWSGPALLPRALAPGVISRWRVLHGISGAIILAYVLFHIANHLFGLEGPSAHAAVMKAGRIVYRAPLIEPVLVSIMLLQVITGLRLAWRWSALPAEWHRVFQIASGFYLSVFILGHMNSVFIYARTVMKIDTGWDFATGAPTGLLYDAWNIRLLPHYALGVFFVLSHLASGLRVVLLTHGIDRSSVDRLWSMGVILSFGISAAIIAGMCGIRL